MLKAHLVDLAVKTIYRAQETKEKIKKNLKADVVQAYVSTIKDVAVWAIENHLKSETKNQNNSPKNDAKSQNTQNTSEPVKSPAPKTVKKIRKSSIRPANEIISTRAEQIMQHLKKSKAKMVKSTEEINGKKSLAYLVWSLGHAKRAKIKNGISIHDVSALLYRASKIELYPINISRVVHSNQNLLKQVGQEKSTKTYLLTELGEKTFQEKFL
ncbi:MAG: hypothetical protein KC505_09020 [Myxococcales bacterium]|nr:hypothetical protein [Myxococcales bacterium]USN50116.1 MAG: hypothetical protein H6731_07540 [Myxococcales bacterium]